MVVVPRAVFATSASGNVDGVTVTDVFGDGCGTAAGAGLADEVGGCGLGDTMLPGFKAFLPRKLCK